MKRFKIGFVLLFLFILAGCSTQSAAEDPDEITAERATAVLETAVTETITSLPATASIAPTATIAPSPTTKTPDTLEPTEMSEEVVTHCVLCHSDKEMLIETARPEEEKEPGESSGVG